MKVYWALSSISKEEESAQLEVLCLFQSSLQKSKELLCLGKGTDVMTAKVLSQATFFNRVSLLSWHPEDIKKIIDLYWEKDFWFCHAVGFSG